MGKSLSRDTAWNAFIWMAALCKAITSKVYTKEGIGSLPMFKSFPSKAAKSFLVIGMSRASYSSFIMSPISYSVK